MVENEGRSMIRFAIGLFLLIGLAGGLEQETVNYSEFFLYAGIGLILIIWPMPKLMRS
jgi:hypothetical protein